MCLATFLATVVAKATHSDKALDSVEGGRVNSECKDLIQTLHHFAYKKVTQPFALPTVLAT